MGTEGAGEGRHAVEACTLRDGCYCPGGGAITGELLGRPFHAAPPNIAGDATQRLEKAVQHGPRHCEFAGDEFGAELGRQQVPVDEGRNQLEIGATALAFCLWRWRRHDQRLHGRGDHVDQELNCIGLFG